jgi:site-specific recombinase XerD
LLYQYWGFPFPSIPFVTPPDKEIDIQAIDYKIERAMCLMTCGRIGSKDTQRVYNSSISKLEQWTFKNKIKLLSMDYAQADDYIYELRQSGNSNASVRLDVSAASGFFNHLERRFPAVKNPFKGTRAKPPEQPKKLLEIPTPDEVEMMILQSHGMDRAVIAVLGLRGLRAGALPRMAIQAGQFITFSKGKLIQGVMPQNVIDEIELAGLELPKPFEGLTANAIEKRVRYVSGKLFKRCAINHQYSAHDLRHCFAAALYKQCKDIKQVQLCLGHENVATTDRYLRSLGFGLD